MGEAALHHHSALARCLTQCGASECGGNGGVDLGILDVRALGRPDEELQRRDGREQRFLGLLLDGDDCRLVAVAYDDESGPAISLATDEVPGQGAFVELTIERRHGDPAIRTRHDVAPERSGLADLGELPCARDVAGVGSKSQP